MNEDEVDNIAKNMDSLLQLWNIISQKYVDLFPKLNNADKNRLNIITMEFLNDFEKYIKTSKNNILGKRDNKEEYVR